ncbi:GNAT family N-acetyltransferase [Altericroceibacterium spongiae]|nr:GNAT family N-acetyltransferase [Altericroceibacterium spongiae]
MARFLDDLGALRISVFAQYPYLYDGDPDYEARYLREFSEEKGSVMVAALEGERLVGAATASPMAGQKPAFRQVFEERGHDVSRIFYFGESVLLSAWRGQGIGHAFFDEREAAARAAGAQMAVFASVIRPAGHPARPAGYSPLDPFWRARGYAPMDGLETELAWKEHGEERESPKALQYWMRHL